MSARHHLPLKQQQAQLRNEQRDAEAKDRQRRPVVTALSVVERGFRHGRRADYCAARTEITLKSRR